MGDKSGIQWTDATWNPVTGCTKVSPGCKNCYAKHQAWPRLAASPKTRYYGRAFEDVQCHQDLLELPLRWRKPRRIFVNSMSDLFHQDVPTSFIDRVFAVMALCPQHTFQILTKRDERMAAILNDHYFEERVFAAAFRRRASPRTPRRCWSNLDAPWPLSNAWLGVSVENQSTADERIPKLLDTPAALRWISVEPLLGSIDLTGISLSHLPWGPPGPPECIRLNALVGQTKTMQRGRAFSEPCPRLDWVVVGGESGTNARPTKTAHLFSIVKQCRDAGVPVFFKQFGSNVIRSCGRRVRLKHRHGGDPAEFPFWALPQMLPQ